MNEPCCKGSGCRCIRESCYRPNRPGYCAVDSDNCGQPTIAAVQIESSNTQNEQPINQTINLHTETLPRLERERILALINEQLDTFNTEESNRTTADTALERNYDVGYSFGYIDALDILKRTINKQ